MSTGIRPKRLSIEIPESDSLDIRKMREILSSFDGDAPSIESYLTDHPVLKNFGVTISNVLKTLGQNQINDANAKVLEDGIKQFIKCVVENQASNAIAQSSITSFSNSTLKILKLQHRVSELELENNELKTEKAEHCEEISNFERERNEFENIKNNLVLQIKQIKRECEELLMNEHQKVEDMNSKYDELKEKLHQSEEQIRSHENTIKSLNEDVDNYKTQLKTTKEKAVSTKEKLITSQERIRLAEQEIASLRVINTQPKVVTPVKLPQNVDEVVRLKKENARLNDTIEELNSLIESQTSELVTYSKDVEDLNEMIANLEDEVETTKSSLKDANKNIDNLKDQKKSLEAEIDDITKDKTRLVSRIAELEDALDNEKAAMKDVINVSVKCGKTDDEVLVDFIKRVSQGKAEESLLAENARLRGLIDQIIPYITSSTEGVALMCDEATRNKVELELAEILKEVGSGDRSTLFETVFGNELKIQQAIDDLQKNNSVDIYAGLIALASVNRSLMRINKEIVNDLAPLRRFIPTQVEDRKLGLEVTKTFKDLIPEIENIEFLVRTIHNYNKENVKPLDLIRLYIKDSALALKNSIQIAKSYDQSTILDEENEDPTQLPEVIRSMIQELETEVQQEKARADRAELLLDRAETKLDQSINEADNVSIQELDKAMVRIQQLEDSLEIANMKNKEDEDLTFKHIEEKKSYDETIRVLKEQKDDLSHNNRFLVNEIERLKRLLDERTNSFERRINAAVEAEHEKNAAEIELLKKRNEDQVKLLTDAVRSKTRKLFATRKSLEETTTQSEEQLNKQRTMINELLAQNKELVQRLSNIGDVVELQNKVEELQAKLQRVTTEKHRAILNANRSPGHSPARRGVEDLPLKIGAKLEVAGVPRPEAGWNSETVVSSISEVASKLKNSSVDSSAILRTKSLSTNLQKWDEWASVSLSKAGVDCVNEAEAQRSALYDLIMAGSKRAAAVSIMQSLRTQKELLKLDLNVDSGVLSFRGLTLSLMFITTLKQKRSISLARQTVSAIAH